jgi:microcystin-dependent protein
MSEPYVGEIRLFAFPRVPDGWLACNGQSLPVSNFDALYAVIGTTYGGDSSNFNLPDLRGRVPLGYGSGGSQPAYVLGQMAGEDSHTLISNELPSHSHALLSSTAAATTVTPGTTVHIGTLSSEASMYAPPANPYATMASCVQPAGNSQPHNNIQPTVVSNYCICWSGIFPSPG